VKLEAYECDYCGTQLIVSLHDTKEGWGTYERNDYDITHICPDCRERNAFKFNDL